MTTEKTWICSCGAFKVKLAGDPTLNYCCQCHSCVAPCRFIDAKHKDGQGASASKDGGIAVSVYASSTVEFPTDLEGKLSNLRVGESGRGGRCYTYCCQSQVTNVVAPKMVALSTNFIKNEDGSPYVPPGTVLNINVKHAFDPNSVPEPKHNSAPVMLILTFLRMFLNPFEPSLVNKYPALFPPSSQLETVPITW